MRRKAKGESGSGPSGDAWNLTGNGGTNPSTDFVGTTDTVPLIFRVNNVEVARFNLVNGFQWGNGSISNGLNSTAFGDATTAQGDNATSFGTVTTANGLNSTAFGSNTMTDGENATAWGSGSSAMAVTATAFGDNTYAAGGMSLAFGNSTVAGSYAPLYNNGGVYYDSLSNELYLFGDYSSLVGQKIIYYDNADGQIFLGEVATAVYSAPFTTIGFTGIIGASTDSANSLSFVAIPSDDTLFATAWGSNTFAGATGATAFGSKTRAGGEYSTAFGIETIAGGQYSFAGGRSGTNARADGSLAFGRGVNAFSDEEVAFGDYNTTYTPANDSTDRAFGIGNGTGTGSESDAFTVLKNGKTGVDMDNLEATTSGAKLQLNGYIGQTYRKVTGAFSFSAIDIAAYVNVDNSSGAFDLQLPDPSSVFTDDPSGSQITSEFTFKLATSNLVNTVRIIPYASETIDGATAYNLTGGGAYQSITVYTDGTNWFIA